MANPNTRATRTRKARKGKYLANKTAMMVIAERAENHRATSGDTRKK